MLPDRRACSAPPQERYLDVQDGYPLIAVLATTSALTVGSEWLWHPSAVVNALLISQLGLVICFCRFFIQANRWGVFWHYGPGWIRGSILLHDIESCQVVADRFAYGWGFQKTALGWRYCRSGSSVLVIQRRDGRKVRLSTARAHELRRFINSAIERPPKFL
ncbi:MAG TPA: hypothetical protein VNB29_04160 [Chthoniobacterales bacterium]|nr:hypothetical protein [Chthoniobacterales bacterium]